MLSRSAGVFTFAACALGASAFLIPADVSADAFTESTSDITVHSLNAKTLALKLPCSECAFSYNNAEKVEDVDEDSWFTIQGGANSVIVNFTISEDGQRLEANGEPVYPMQSAMVDMFRAPKHYVKQVPESATLLDIANGESKSIDLEVTGHGISIMSEESVSENGDKLIPIKYTIFELNNQPVSVDEVTIQLLSTKEHGLLIAHDEISKRPTPRPDDSFGNMPEGFPFRLPSSDNSPPKECKNLPAAICKLRNIIEEKVKGMQDGVKKGKPGCHGRKGKNGPLGVILPNHIRPHFHKDGEDGERHHGRPHHMRPHGHHGHHHDGHHKGFYHAFTRGLSAVLIPTMAGIAVGMTVSLIGLVVGRLIGFFWIRFYRGGRRGYSSVAADEINAESIEAAKEFAVRSTRTSMESAPPLYEHAPAYEVIVKEEK